jgi:hypothetical protein
MKNNAQHDEDKVLTGYIWSHYQHLMTEFERETGQAIIGREKAANTNSERMATKLNQNTVRIDREDINQALSGGADMFRKRVCDRILLTYPTDVFINRCPNCRRIVRTPVGRLCTWCGHTWFETNTSDM